MYIPESFRQADVTALHALMREASFALVISTAAGALEASHLPLLLDAEAGERGHLLGHFARANGQWRALDGQEVLAVFSGPHAYVSPTWYGAAGMVPTWNYVAVHAYGRCRLLESREELLELLTRLTHAYEQGQPQPWSFAADDPRIDKLLAGIVGFRIEVSRLEGKWKLGQNHPAEVRQNAAAALAAADDPQSQAIARLMRATLE